MLQLLSRLAAAPRSTTSVVRPAFTAAQRSFATGPSSSDSNFKASELFDCSHVTALVTGGGTGIGLMISQALVANGAKVYITGRRQEVLDKTVQLYNTGPGSLHSIVGDVSSKEGAMKLAKEMEQREKGGFQLLVNSAGIARDDSTKFSNVGSPDSKDPQAISDHFMKSEESAWMSTFQTNVMGQYFTSMALLPLLAKGNERTPGYTSSIVNVSSISGAMKSSSMGQFAYASSKACFTHLSRMMGTIYKDIKVRVNVIAPAVFPSEMTTGKSDENNKSQIDPSSQNPAGRKGKESDMAATILFLAGKGGVYYNEQIMYPDGGQLLAVPSVK